MSSYDNYRTLSLSLIIYFTEKYLRFTFLPCKKMVYTHHISHTYPHLQHQHHHHHPLFPHADHHHRGVGMIRTSILPGERHSELNQDNSLLSLLPCTLIFITTFIIAQLLLIIIITVVITTIPVPSKTLPCLVLRSDVNGCFVVLCL